jgi:phosphopantetheinyl transferase
MKLPFLKWLRKRKKSPRATAATPRFEIAADGGDAGTVFENGTFRFRQLASQNAAEVADHASEIDLWIIPVEAMPRLAREHDVLSEDERRHAAQINHNCHRIRYTAVRTALRFALSHRVEDTIESGNWRISTPPNGKPQICSEQANCSFSITHSDDFSVIAIAPDSTVGIDAERVDNAKLKHLPFECLSENEQQRMKAKAEDEQYYDFFRFWTLKEAYTKAIGLGLFVDFDSIEFNLGCAWSAADTTAANAVGTEKYELLTLKYLEFEHLLAICLLGVARGSDHQAAKNLYVVEQPKTERAEARSTRETETMNTCMQIIDMSNPERIELYSLEDLPALLHECVEAQSGQDADHIALEIDGEPVSYGELNARADEIAGFLADRGVTAGDMVAVYQDVSSELFISLLGIMKAGAAYVPIDPKHGAERAQRIIGDHNASFVLVSGSRAKDMSCEGLVVIDDVRAEFSQFAGFSAECKQGPTSVSHVAFKAHRTNETQGIAVSHADAVKFAYSLAALYGVEPHHRCFQDTHLAFDVALEEVWAMLCAGATVVLDSNAAANARETADAFIARNDINVVSTAPEFLAEMDGDLPSVEVMIVGGSPCASKLAVKWALRTGRIVSIKKPGDRFPTFSIEQENGAAWRPRMLPPHAADRAAA